MKHSRELSVLALMMVLCSCMSTPKLPPRIPAVEYSQRLHRERAAMYGMPLASPVAARHFQAGAAGDPMAQFAAGHGATLRQVVDGGAGEGGEIADASAPIEGVYAYRAPVSHTRDYNGPLSLGDPGLSSSLWRESSGGNDLFRDQRAFQPMDLITIIVSEDSKGSKKADTEVKESSDLEYTIQNLFGLEDSITKSNPNLATGTAPALSLDILAKAASTNNFKGEGKTNREGKLTARLSVMVVEVLPSGILRIEGEKIISVNNEEQNMVISGLVRPRDISSTNEVDSSKIGNLRIDYFGAGTVGEAQNGGWLGRILRKVMPF